MTVFSNTILLRYGVKTAVVSTIVLMFILNCALFYLLSLERELQSWINKQSKNIRTWQKNLQRFNVGESALILIVYTLSGPAMAGVPLLWVLGIKGKKAYFYITIGVTINSILWVGGVYHVFWILAYDAISSWTALKKFF
ncbi:MAG: hypothetical protein A2782_00860 [Candidatus Blackburnbacteria bacterium RIFCSPHIGHO2_01_FULL_43_15b]|uniref:Uncharacterized protein n=1 Tax=Candidatus Blackburnbacteria bacterium RIFCSPHIGHO2_01_FULL_43_15b TaxID=1797513 RepID=A0A1G1V0W4_9BACT|nr:MAG: hypothetical protein A2782_00860 [Candidatus Blackburnbacteria bacterium RIFCSPHIGHO2_01_FULL_43_15b]